MENSDNLSPVFDKRLVSALFQHDAWHPYGIEGKGGRTITAISSGMRGLAVNEMENLTSNLKKLGIEPELIVSTAPGGIESPQLIIKGEKDVAIMKAAAKSLVEELDWKDYRETFTYVPTEDMQERDIKVFSNALTLLGARPTDSKDRDAYYRGGSELGGTLSIPTTEFNQLFPKPLEEGPMSRGLKRLRNLLHLKR